MNQAKRLKSILDILNEIYDVSYLDTNRSFSLNYSDEEYLEYDIPGGNEYLQGVTSIYNLLERENAITKLKIDTSRYLITCNFYITSDFNNVLKKYESEYKTAIANKLGNTNKSNDSEIVYEVKLIDRRIYINNIVLSRASFGTENEEFFRYIFNHPDEKLNIEEVFKTIKIDKLKKIQSILDNLGFKKKVKEMFFDVSKEFIKFTPIITKKALKDRQLDSLTFKDFNDR